MKLTDIDLSSLAEVAAAVTLLEHVHRELATGGTPLPELIVNPAPSPAGGHTHWQDADAMERFVAAEAEKLRGQQVVNPAPALATGDAVNVEGFGAGTVGEVVMTCAARTLDFGFPTADLAADAEKLRGLGVDPVTAQQMDAAAVFGGAPAQSAAPLPPAPSTAGVAASPTAPAAPPASGVLPTLPALAPLPAPAAAAPAAPAAPSSPAGGVELDTDGLPWDERIHAGTKRKNADGRWTSKRGINDPDLVPSVVKQLREMMATGGLISGNINAQPVATAPAPHVKAEPVDALKTLAALPANPTSTLAALQAAMMPASAAPAPTTFQDFMTALTVEVQAGRVPISALTEVCQPLGGVTALKDRPELIPVAWASLKAKYPGML